MKLFQKATVCKALFFSGALIISVPSHANLQGFFNKKCINSLGSISIPEPTDAVTWSRLGLSAPTRMLRVLVDESKCFTVVDRGLGLAAAQAERNLAQAGHLKDGQNINAGQLRAADYVLVPELIGQNINAGGGSYGVSGSAKPGFLSSVANMATLGVSGKLSGSSHKKTAEVVLSLVDVRTSENIASVSADAKVTDRVLNAAIAANKDNINGQAHYSSWENTPIGQVIKEAYVDAFAKLVIVMDKKGVVWRQPNQQNNASFNSAPLQGNEPMVITQKPSVPVVQPQVVQVSVPTQQAINQTVSNAGQKIDEAVQKLSTASSIALQRMARLLKEPQVQSETLAELQPGMIVYPTGKLEGNLLQVEDELGNLGWVPRSAMVGRN